MTIAVNPSLRIVDIHPVSKAPEAGGNQPIAGAYTLTDPVLNSFLRVVAALAGES
ncbi:hypothetical protein [Sphingomonas sp. G-3-2-10]|jgi:hypothetical protein|uniref:hypothetical protein n=1 Tax=Sphingomonas sp. G-3-2-10 TaxID=2728838 RepID=UPI00146D346E|nr:hypothetical protein [Sphingomonas sp. G-3-2-10]NML07130.1 hypothetical protein [Sphingomonas sp. G-3-2-10]